LRIPRPEELDVGILGCDAVAMVGWACGYDGRGMEFTEASWACLLRKTRTIWQDDIKMDLRNGR
jgi:hypothetical protein